MECFGSDLLGAINVTTSELNNLIIIYLEVNLC